VKEDPGDPQRGRKELEELLLGLLILILAILLGLVIFHKTMPGAEVLRDANTDI
jgi:hypothetical protein